MINECRQTHIHKLPFSFPLSWHWYRYTPTKRMTKLNFVRNSHTWRTSYKNFFLRCFISSTLRAYKDYYIAIPFSSPQPVTDLYTILHNSNKWSTVQALSALRREEIKGRSYFNNRTTTFVAFSGSIEHTHTHIRTKEEEKKYIDSIDLEKCARDSECTARCTFEYKWIFTTYERAKEREREGRRASLFINLMDILKIWPIFLLPLFVKLGAYVSPVSTQKNKESKQFRFTSGVYESHYQVDNRYKINVNKTMDLAVYGSSVYLKSGFKIIASFIPNLLYKRLFSFFAFIFFNPLVVKWISTTKI